MRIYPSIYAHATTKRLSSDAFCWFELGTSKLLLNLYPDKLSRQQSGT
jgi:hypothetical protein